jgi:hypothetical protein
MKVLPFYLKQKQSKGQLCMTKLSVFLANGGRVCWQTDEKTVTKEQLVEEYLEPNGLVPLNIYMENSMILVQIDPEKTILDNFYTWEEVYQKKQRYECWRNFYFFKDTMNAEWFTPKDTNDLDDGSIQEYYEDILRHITK